jgi:esterase/lipase superfamily enzyme
MISRGDNAYEMIADDIVKLLHAQFSTGHHIGPNTDIRKLFQYTDEGWLSLGSQINQLPNVRKFGLQLDENAMRQSSTLLQIVEALKSGRKKTTISIKNAEDFGFVYSREAGFFPQGSNLHIDAVGRRAARVNDTYRVWYGTNRKPLDPKHISQGYSSERDEQVHVGACQVFIPASHQLGSLGSSFVKRLLTGVDDRLKLIDIQESPPKEFWQEVATHLKSCALNERDGVVFIHGYNVSFESAALHAAQIGHDLSIRAMAFFSWPSRGALRGYTADEATIDASEPHIAKFLADFAELSGASKIHIIAHSMGNRGVLRAVNEMLVWAQERTRVPFDQIILAAADVDAGTFKNLCAAYSRVARRTTMYVSSRDRAVEASEWRAGSGNLNRAISGVSA